MADVNETSPHHSDAESDQEEITNELIVEDPEAIVSNLLVFIHISSISQNICHLRIQGIMRQHDCSS